MFANGQSIIQLMEQLAPKHLAVLDDKIGLQLGTLNKEVKNILVALDVTDEVVNEAIDHSVDLIIAHHAIIYRPLHSLQTDFPAGKLYEKLIKHNIAVYIAHTNLDTAVNGVNDLMSEALNIKTTGYLEEVYVDKSGQGYGLGRIGMLQSEITLGALGDQVKEAFEVPAIRIVGDLEQKVKKVAVLGGAGGRYVKHALFRGAEVLITGDIDYHTAHDALAAGLSIIDPGHNVEKIMKKFVAEYLKLKLEAKKYHSHVYASQVNTEPFRFR